MEVIKLVCGELQSNTYVVKNGKRGFLVDCAGDFKNIQKIIATEDITVEGVLLTHGHFDHADAAAKMQERSVKIYAHSDDAQKLCTNKNMGLFLGFNFQKFTADILLEDEEIVEIAGLSVKVLHTPGHSAGSVCYMVEDAIFTGDTIFKLSYGRTDFYDGDFEQLRQSIFKILSLDKNFKLYPGHGEQTDLQFEKLYNPIFLDLEDDND